MAASAAAITVAGSNATDYAERVGGCPVPKPSGVLPGDRMLMQAYVENPPPGESTTTLASSGWELVEQVENKSWGVWFALAVFTKKYEESDPQEYTVTWTGTSKRGCGALVAAWSGVSPGEPINAHLGAASAGASTTVRGPSIVTTKANSMVVMLGDYNSVDSRMLPPGMEEVAGPEGLIAQVLQPEAKATGDKDATIMTAAGTIGFLVALTPEVPPPTVTGVSPSEGPEAGGSTITITGTNLNAASAVKFGSSNAASFTVNSATSITASSPAGSGTVHTTVTTPGGTSSMSTADQFSYVPPPTVTTGVASSVGQTSGTLNATVNPNGDAVSECEFDYGTSASYGSSAPCATLPGAGSSPVGVSAAITGLSANTTYYFRIVATSEAGTSDGTEQTLKTASPELPELGRCLKLGKATGKYKTAACTTTSVTEDTGKYEWEPWAAPKDRFSFNTGAATLETVGKSSVKCLENTLAGEYSGSQRAGVTIVYRGCEASGRLGGKCSSEGAGEGEVRAEPLSGVLGFIKGGTKPSAGWDLSPASGQTLATFQCGASEVSVTGSVIAPVTPLDKMSASFALKFKASRGKQVPEEFESGTKDTLSFITSSVEEQAGITASGSMGNEESLEIKAIA